MHFLTSDSDSFWKTVYMVKLWSKIVKNSILNYLLRAISPPWRESDIYIWHLYLTITFEIYIWHLSLTFISDISIWHLYLTFTSNNYIWHLYLTFIFDIHIWHFYLAFISDIYIWHLYMALLKRKEKAYRSLKEY